jgi:hypothetical protein
MFTKANNLSLSLYRSTQSKAFNLFILLFLYYIDIYVYAFCQLQGSIHFHCPLQVISAASVPSFFCFINQSFWVIGFPKLLIMQFFSSFLILSLPQPHIVTITLFSNTIIQFFSFCLSDRPNLHPQKTTENHTHIYIRVFIFLDIVLEGKRFLTG